MGSDRMRLRLCLSNELQFTRILDDQGRDLEFASIRIEQSVHQMGMCTVTFPLVNHDVQGEEPRDA